MSGRWIPKISDTDLVNKSYKGLLSIAKKKIKESPTRFFKDSHGVFAFETKNYVVVAKEYPYGWVVSAHEQIIKYALDKKKPLVMYINKNKRLYKFSPRQIISEGTRNRRGDSRFINFDIRNGVRMSERIKYVEEAGQKKLGEWK
jgi:hypothetical protein